MFGIQESRSLVRPAASSGGVTAKCREPLEEADVVDIQKLWRFGQSVNSENRRLPGEKTSTSRKRSIFALIHNELYCGTIRGVHAPASLKHVAAFVEVGFVRPSLMEACTGLNTYNGSLKAFKACASRPHWSLIRTTLNSRPNSSIRGPTAPASLKH